MDRYFIDLINGHGTMVDDEGQMFDTAHAAGREALRILMEIAFDEQVESEELSLMTSVRNDVGDVVYEGRLSLAGRWVSPVG